MARQTPLWVVLFCLACRLAAVRAETPHSYAAIVPERDGRQTLSIAYPWTIHPQASIEVRLTPRDATAIVTPIYFVAEQFKGAVSGKVYKCLDLAEQGESMDSFVKDKVAFRIVARRNSLGRPAALVIPEDKGDENAPRSQGPRRRAGLSSCCSTAGRSTIAC